MNCYNCGKSMQIATYSIDGFPYCCWNCYQEKREQRRKVKAKEVQFYSETAKSLVNTQRHKILKFLEYKCIEYVGKNQYICKPIPDYNSTTYALKKVGNDFECSCQAFQKAKSASSYFFCSHIGALMEFFARGQVYA